MAGPFELPANTAREVSGIRLVSAPSAPSNQDSTIAALGKVSEAVGVVAEANEKRQEATAIKGVTDEVRAVRDALYLKKHPIAAQSYFSEASLQDPYIQSVYKNFNEISNAVSQGRLSNEYGLERMETVMQAAISKRPQFADAIRAAANSAAGANISAKVFSQIMSTSPQEAAQAQLRKEATLVGLDLETYAQYKQQAFLREQQMNAINLQKAQGEIGLSELQQFSNMGVARLTTDLQAGLLRQINAGGVIDVPTVKQQTSMQFTALRNQVRQNIPAGLSGGQLNAVLKSIDDEEARVMKMIENGSMVNLMQTQSELFKEASKEKLRLGAPTITSIYAGFGGGQAGIEAVTLYSKYKANPEKFSGIFALENGGVLSMAEAMVQVDQAGKVIRGEATADTPRQQRLAAYLGLNILKNPQADTNEAGETAPRSPQEIRRIVDIVTEEGLEYSTTSLANSKVAATISNYKETHNQVINHYRRAVADLQLKYNEWVRNPVVNDSMFSIEGGQFVTDVSAVSALPPDIRSSVIGQTSALEKQANRVLRLGKVYSLNGVFPETVFKDVETLFNNVKTLPTGEAPQPQEEKVINVTLNPDGSFTME